jgi:hypothetical protein
LIRNRVQSLTFLHRGADTLINAVPHFKMIAMLQGFVEHAPGPPDPVHEMTDPTTTRPEAVNEIEDRFPAATPAQPESRTTGFNSRRFARLLPNCLFCWLLSQRDPSDSKRTHDAATRRNDKFITSHDSSANNS